MDAHGCPAGSRGGERRRSSVAVSTAVLVAVIYGLLLAAIGLILATDYALVLWQRVRTIMARFARRSLAFSAAVVRIARAGWPAGSAAFAFIAGLGVAIFTATWAPRAARPPRYTTRVGVVILRSNAPPPSFCPAVRASASSVPHGQTSGCPGLRRERDISVGYLAFGLLAALTAGVLALFLVSSCRRSRRIRPATRSVVVRLPRGADSRRRLRPGEAAAPERESLALLSSGSDAVRTLPVRGTRPSTPRARDLIPSKPSSDGVRSRWSGCRVQGTANSPPSATGRAQARLSGRRYSCDSSRAHSSAGELSLHTRGGHRLILPP